MLCCMSIHAQSLKKIVKQADILFQEGNFKNAAIYYKDGLSIEPDNAYLNFKYGWCLLNSTFSRQSLPFLQKAYQLDQYVDDYVTYFLAQSLQLNLQFKEARRYYELFGKSHPTPNETERVKKRLRECDYGEQLVAHPVTAQIQNMGKELNSKYGDYVPVIKADGSEIVFTSTREGTTGNSKSDDGEFLEDIYISYNTEGKWTQAKNMGPPINTASNDASIGLSPDGNTMFFFRGENNGDVYYAKLTGAGWGSPKPFKEINTKYSELHCTITPDGNTLFFSSDRPGGYGGFDLYRITKDPKGRWKAPENLGPKVNTEENEDSPFIHPDGSTLYFSSKGHSTMGGYDIFKIHIQNGQWQQVENMGYPINSPEDDIYFVLSADKQTGYFSSAKEDTYGEKDLYKISMPKPVQLATAVSQSIESSAKPVKKELNLSIATAPTLNPITILKGTIRDAITKKPLEAKIFITDNSKNEQISETESNASTGSYLVILPSGKNYGITVNKDQYLFHSENFDIPSTTNYQEVVVDVDLKKVIVGTKIILKNIFFDFDKSTLRSESLPELERLLSVLRQTTIIIKISGHTDNLGKAEYNKSLSQQRAKAVVDYLTSKGIAKDRMSFEGYGFEKPIAANSKPDGSDNPEGRQLNRRTEFEIIGTK